ncbi:hypothetical protein AABB24_022925 [Solanum stoloniferum]|uniref:Uncharacterized protein n=1 Tax=Solanum stoloniferum TaxID=62892 RepID=A0ABD2T2R6_9SOLN
MQCSAPSSFERQFRKEHPGLYNHLQEAPTDKVGWKDVIHWMWPLFTEKWGSWRSLDLNLSSLPFTDPVTGLPTFHERLPSPLLLYGFSKEVVEYPGYWPSKVRVCGFWFPPKEWQFSCNDCAEISASVSSGSSNKQNELCSIHLSLQVFIEFPATELPIFIGLSSIGRTHINASGATLQALLLLLQFQLNIRSFTLPGQTMTKFPTIPRSNPTVRKEHGFLEEPLCIPSGPWNCIRHIR